jgi:hypothetical protein
MIAEPPSNSAPSARLLERLAATSGEPEQPALSLGRIAAALQVVLATRRAARGEEYAYWYTVARGM